MKKNIGVVAIVIALLLGGYGTLRSLPAPINTTTQIGSMASPDSPYSWASFGGVKYEFGHSESFTSATTTLCAFPITATSTLVSADLRINNTTGANEFQIGIGYKNSNATTTLLESLAVASGLKGEAVATTSGAKTIANGWILRPNDWIVFKVATGTPGVVTFTGSCNAVWHPM